VEKVGALKTTVKEKTSCRMWAEVGSEGRLRVGEGGRNDPNIVCIYE
jgi:hypothetical protein